MKRSSLFTNVLFVLLLVAAGLAATANAITYTWDVLPGTVDPGNGQIDDGAGTWDAADANNWTIDGGANNIKWTDGNDAVFGTGAAGAAGVVALGGTVQPNKITFNAGNGGGNYSITSADSANYLKFFSDSSTLTVDVPTSGVTGTISANLGSTTTWTNANNKIAKTGAGKLVLSGISYLFDERNGNGTAMFSVDGGGELEITGFVKAASSAQSNRNNGWSTIGANSANNTVKLTGPGALYTDTNLFVYSHLMAGGITIGGGTFGNNKLTMDTPGDLGGPLGYTARMQGNGAAMFIGVNSSNNSLEIKSGAYYRQSGGGGANGWGIGVYPGAQYNSILIDGTDGAGNRSTLDRQGAAGSVIDVGGPGNGSAGNPNRYGNHNNITISNGGLLAPRRLQVGVGGSAAVEGDGSYNYVLVTGAGSELDNRTSARGTVGTNGKAVVGVGNYASNNYILIEDGGKAWFENGTGNGNTMMIGATPNTLVGGGDNGSNNNYIQVTGLNSALNIQSSVPFTVGGNNGAGSPTVPTDGGTGNHLDIYNGGSLDMCYANLPGTGNAPVYVMGTNSAFNLGDGGAISTAKVGALTAYANTGIWLKNADGRLNINNGRLTAGAVGALVSGLGQVNFNGLAYIDTAGFDTLIDSNVTGAGGLTKEGEGSLTISGAHDYAGETIVKSGGTLGLEQVGLDDAAAVKIEKVGAVYGKMEIGFTGGDVVGELWLGGAKMTRPGAYNETNYPNYFVGTTGWLLVITSNVPGDTNNDGVVDAADYITVKQNFGMTDATLGAEQGDFDKDGTVEWDDLQTLMANFSTRSIDEAPAAPEPATLGLLAIGALAVLRRRSCLRP